MRKIRLCFASSIVFVNLVLSYFGNQAIAQGVLFDSDKVYGSFRYTLESPGDNFELAFSDPTHSVVSSTEYQYTRHFENSSLHFGNAYNKNETLLQLGASFNNTRLDAFSGYGKTQAQIRHRYSNVDPFLFHGGTDQKFDFSGVALSQSILKTAKLTATYTDIKSESLEDRSVYSLGISGQHYNLSLMQVDRGNQSIGSAWSVGANYAGHRFEMDYLEQENGASLQALNYSKSYRGKRYRIALQTTENPLYEAKNENRIVFSMGFSIGANNYKWSATDSEEESEEPKSNKNTYLIGAGAVGVGLALSSGSSKSDNSVRVDAQHEAAREVLNRINPESVRLNREHGGYIYRNADGSFSSTEPILGEVASILLPNPVLITPPGTVTTASYHTHGGPDPRFDNENFSPQDILSDRLFSLDGYLGTPGGFYKYHRVSTGEIFTLGMIAN